MNLDKMLSDVRNSEPAAAEIEQAAERVRGRLFPKVEAGAASVAGSGAIRGCADFTALIPAFLAGTLDSGRKMLFEVHTRECLACRKALAEARTGARQVIEFKPRQKTMSYQGWAIAAAALLAVGSGSYWAYLQYPAVAGGPRATVDSIDGALYKVAGQSLTPLAPGAELGEKDEVRTAKSSTAVVRLNDGSRIELNQRTGISVTRDWGGSTIHLALGNIIVQAAKQRRGTLQVATADCNVSVKGTVFSVDAGTRGSRVAVVEGTVWVDHGSKHDVLHRGDMTATTADLGPVQIRDQFSWSRNSGEYLPLLAEFKEITKQIAAIPPAGLRYDSNLLNLLPPDVAATAAIPNIGDTLQQASQIFHSHLNQNPQLSQWWNGLQPQVRSNFEATIQRLETASAYIGNEIVIAAVPSGKNLSPVIVAQIVKPGLDTYLRAELPPAATDGHMRFDNGLFVAAANPADLDRIGNQSAAAAPLIAQLRPAYQQGAGWLFGADLARMSVFKPDAPGLAGARFLVAQSRTTGGVTENRASLSFTGDRQGVASWLLAPGPMGSLEYVSPDAGFAASLLLKNPSLIVDDLLGVMSRVSGDASNGVGPLRDKTGVDLKSDLAGAFGGEMTVALDGPLFPVPSWKIAAEVYYPDRLQSSISKIVAAYNEQPNRERTGDLSLTQADDEGRTFYTLKFEKLPWGATWTFADGYWLAAANRELIIRSLQNRQTGYTLPKSNAFRSQLPRDASTDFSAVIYHNLGQTLAPVFSLLGKSSMVQSDTPGIVCFWAEPNRIDVATVGSLFGLKLESLLAMQGGGPLKMLTEAASGKTLSGNPRVEKHLVETQIQ